MHRLDCSIAPGNVGANTYNTAIAIGEKAAVLIAAELEIQRVYATRNLTAPIRQRL